MPATLSTCWPELRAGTVISSGSLGLPCPIQWATILSRANRQQVSWREIMAHRIPLADDHVVVRNAGLGRYSVRQGVIQP
jgi:hypothetical protein